MFVGAGNDEVVSTRAIADYARRLRGGAILTIAGARHEMLQEADIFREQLLAAFDAFVPGNDEGISAIQETWDRFSVRNCNKTNELITRPRRRARREALPSPRHEAPASPRRRCRRPLPPGRRSIR